MFGIDSKLPPHIVNKAQSTQKTTNNNKIVLLFDIDSTLVSLMPGLSHQVFADAFADVFGIRPSAKHMGSFAGKTDKQIITEVGKNLGMNDDTVLRKTDDVIIALTKHSSELFSENSIELLPGVRDLLQHLISDDRFVIGLVTGNNRSCAALKLKPHGLHDYFEFGAFGCESEDRRHLPPLALERATRLNPNCRFSAEKVVVIGDSEGDVRCAMANNMMCIAVATGHSSAEELIASGAHAVVESLNEKSAFMGFIESLSENVH